MKYYTTILSFFTIFIKLNFHYQIFIATITIHRFLKTTILYKPVHLTERTIHHPLPQTATYKDIKS